MFVLYITAEFGDTFRHFSANDQKPDWKWQNKNKTDKAEKLNTKAPMGFEPMTSCLQDRRSNQLSYGALVDIIVIFWLEKHNI